VPKTIYDRLRDYYTKVGAVLRGEADAGSIFPNSTDVGMSREKVYANFLAQHAPSMCRVFFGGFLFDEAGAESKQLDIIITTDTTPRFDFHNQDGSGKSFSHVEGTLGVVSVKSTLRVCPRSLCIFTKPPQHKADGSELDEGERDPGQVLKVFCEPSAATEPGEGSLNHPSLRQNLKSLGLI